VRIEFQQLRRLSGAALAALAFSACGQATARPAVPDLAVVGPSALCATSGAVRDVGDQTMEVEAPVFRGVVPEATASAAEVQFVYDGPTAETTPLASGELRRDISLKLRARDACNVVYVVYKIEPVSELAVLVKSNPDARRSSECGDRGYQRLTPETSRPVPEIRVGEPHLLKAEVDGESLSVFVDRELAWQGKLPESAFGFDGPVGIRTDNGRFRFRFAGAASEGSGGGSCEEHAAG
jgi:hypothetical protein